MHTTATLAEHLRILCGDPDRGDRLAASFERLAHLVARVVPSSLAVSIIVMSLEAEIAFDVPTRLVGSAAVLASLAVPLSAGEPGALLILRAADAGAFAPLAADLSSLLGVGGGGGAGGGGPPIAVDRHLRWPPAVTVGSLAAELADLRAVNQAIGTLIERGWEPAAALGELRRRADEANSALGAASRLVLEPRPPRTT